MTGLLILVIFAVYMFPAIVAYRRNHRQAMAIAVLSFFLGWTLIGWVAALVWACTTDVSGPAPSLLQSRLVHNPLINIDDDDPASAARFRRRAVLIILVLFAFLLAFGTVSTIIASV